MSENAATPGVPIRVLTARMAHGEPAAFQDFHDVYFPRLFRYLLVVTGGQEETARDALQSTLLRVVHHVRRFESDEAFWSWLTVLARSAVVDEMRKGQRHRSLLDRFLRQSLPPPGPGDGEIDSRLHGLLEQNLPALAVEDRALLERKYIEHQPVKAIATALGTTDKAVESRLARARQQLKKLILAQLKDEDAP